MSEKVLPAFDGATPEMLPDKDKMYFNDYATLVQQQGMLQDHVRTSIYQFAVYENKEDFRGKRVLDVGAGTGILSFFAAKAGASQVYAVEASGMALKAEKLAAGNGLQDIVTVVNKRVEEVTLDEKVDVLISEPLGIALVNERMIESYLVARDLLLKPGGKMYPDHAVLHASPFCDEALYNEQTQKANFWAAHDFYGIDLSPVQGDAHSFYFSQPAVQRVEEAACGLSWGRAPRASLEAPRAQLAPNRRMAPRSRVAACGGVGRLGGAAGESRRVLCPGRWWAMCRR